MESIKNKVAIVGVGYTPQGKIPGRNALSFHLEAAKNAIEDAGLEIGDIDGLLTQPPPADPTVTPWTIAQQLGLRIRFCSEQHAMGATAGCMVFHAAGALVYGLANYVVCTYGESPLSGGTGVGTYARPSGDRPAFGWYVATTGYAMAGRRCMHEVGTVP